MDREYFKDTEKYKSAKVLINKFKKELVKEGFVVLAREADCNTCSIALLPKDCKKYCYWHDQAWDSFKTDGGLMLGWGEEQKEGIEICNTAEKLGIDYKWNGSVDTKIELIFGGRQ